MTSQSGGGSGYPGVTGDGSVPPGLDIQGGLAVGGNAAITGSLSGDATLFQTQPGGGITIGKTDDNFEGLAIKLTNGSSGPEVRISQADAFGVQRTVCVVNADGSIESTQGLGTHGVAAQSSPRTLAQSAITAITDANAKTAVQACANALSDVGALTIT